MRFLVVSGFMMLAVSGCSLLGDTVDRGCPQTAIIRELERVKDYGNDTPEDANLVATSFMKTVQGQCISSDKGVDVNFQLTLLAGRGPRLGSDHFSFPYFISVVDSNRQILSKEMLTAEFKFGDEKKITTDTEALHVFIPLDKGADAKGYQVLMGFQLTDEQRKGLKK